jgi:pyruvate dehydrogenase phosphatase
LVGYGAWYTYKVQSGNKVGVVQQVHDFSTTTATYGPDPTGSEAVRKALIVGPDTLYTGEIKGNEPISKDTDESGRKVLEMLTPEQATQKLRRNEESYLVGRGQGVVRYDVVQIPSNDPIEDDHVEKIIELPSAIATASGKSASDWMFWGVFDGHS